MKPTDNHPGLSSALYADAFWARARGDADRAWALEEEAFTQPHFTPIDWTARGLARIRHGDFARGFLDYEHRLSDARHQKRTGCRFMWTHEPWQRFACDAYGNWTERRGWERELRELTILVGREGGIGDMIMLSRFLPWLAERAKHVYWLVPPDFRRLAVYGYGHMVEVIAQEDLPPFDRYVMMFSLPAIVGGMMPDRQYARTHQPDRWMGGDDPPLRQDATGIAWAGNPAYAEGFPLYGNTDIRSMDHPWARQLANALYDLVEDEGARLISYQRGAGLDAWTLDFVDDQRIIGDWFDTYRSLARECQRVVTVDTGLAHLAAAMGIPTYTLLAYDHCFRWGSKTPDGRSVWYPSMQLISQNAPGDWSYPIADVVRQLKAEKRA